MKPVLSSLFLLFFTLAFSQVNWMTMNQAIAAQKVTPKKILIDFYTKDSEASKEMEKLTFAHPEILKYLNDKFYVVKFNSEGNETVNIYNRIFKNTDSAQKSDGKHSFAKFMNINNFPTLIFLDENLQTITNLVGKFTPKDLEPYLSMIANNQYKNIKTREQWESYQKKFKSKIKN